MDLAIKGTGQNDKKFLQIDPTHQALRASMRPLEFAAYGSYRKALKSGVIAAGLTGPLPIWEMRWGNSDPIAILRKLRVFAIASTTAFASTAADASISLYRATGFTALDATNGTLGSFTVPKTGALSTRFPPSQFAGDTTATRTQQGGIVILNTSSSGLTGGTKALDSDPIATLPLTIIASAAAETPLIPGNAPLYMIDPADTPAIQPLELNMSEGLVLQADAITATGTWRLMVDVTWDEVDPGKYFGFNG